MSETEIVVYGREDLKKSGGFKKKNNIKKYDKKNFFIYLKTNNLKINSQYIDHIGEITNEKRFRCSYNNFIIGTSAIVKEFGELENE
jgi:hypothetical protein